MALDTGFHSILFPVDFSEMSAATAPHVRGFAELTGATVTLLHIVPWLSSWYGTTELRSAVLGDRECAILNISRRLSWNGSAKSTSMASALTDA